MDVLRGLIGITLILGTCYLLSSNRRAVSWRLIVSGLLVQVILGLFVFKTSLGVEAIQAIATGFSNVLDFSYAGSSFLFGSLGARDAPEAYLGFRMLPIIIYFSALMAILYHLGVMQLLIYGLARALGRVLGVSGAESMAVAANIFVGMTEAPLVIRPYLERLTRSELMALMCGGFATVAGSVLGIYLMMVGKEYGPYLIAASVMSAPAAFVIAKTLIPETEESITGAGVRFEMNRQAHNVFDAIAVGVRDGLYLALNIGAMLIAFYALIALINWPLTSWFGLTLQQLLGFLLQPLAWCLGAEWGDESKHLGTLIGIKLCVNEFIAYQNLQQMIAADSLSPRTIKIATFALCGFANVGSIGVTLGGLGHLIPSRRAEFSRLVLPAMFAGACASFLTAAIAGILL